MLLDAQQKNVYLAQIQGGEGSPDHDLNKRTVSHVPSGYARMSVLAS